MDIAQQSRSFLLDIWQVEQRHPKVARRGGCGVRDILHHAQHPIILPVETEMASRHVPDSGKEAFGERFAQHSHLLLGLHLFPCESPPFEETEREDLPESAIDIVGYHLERLHVRDGRLAVAPNVKHTARYGFYVRHIRQQMLHGPVGYSAVDVPVLGFAFRVSLRSFHHQSSVAVILRIDGGKLDVEDDEQCHHQCNGQPRT